MRHNDSHLSDEDLLLAADGELPASDAKRVEDHLAGCWDCRARRKRLEGTISNLVEARHAELDPQLPPDVGRRALLKAHVAQMAAEPEIGKTAHVFPWIRVRRVLTLGLAVAAAIIFVALGTYRVRMRAATASIAQGPLEPQPSLTPGAVRTVSAPEICRATIEDDRRVLAIPVSLKQQVFREYGMDKARPQDFEVDFLITPELGGSNDIRNLWPEPYHAAVWNAHVKDELEDRLREMVCDGQIDLRTAQRDISADWILAYKKYFHTDRPL
jgi:hypothetical protein